jgi:tRNA (adenine57-N1/adenine58-N1)-methyltransferase
MYETLLRTHEVNQAPRLAHIGHVAERLKQLERNREDKRQRQIAASRARRHTTEKRKRDDDDDGAGVVVDPDRNGRGFEATKKAKTVAQSDGDTPAPDVIIDVDEDDQQPLGVTAAVDGATPSLSASAPAPATQVLSRHSKEVRGHTSFLTFACLLPTTQPQAPTP